MSRYIDADALKAFIKDQYFQCDMPEEWGNGVMWATSQINHYCNKAPSIDIEPKRGEWIGYNADKGDDWLRSDGEPIFLVCNKCHGTVINNGSAHWNFCPNCGADMREREGE